MKNNKYTGLIKESIQPMQGGTAATVKPVTKALTPFVVQEVLQSGKDNAISSEALADRLGFDSVRSLQKEIERERKAGAVILSTCENGGGYFLPECNREVKQFIRTLENRASNTLAALESAKTYIRQHEEAGEGECSNH